MNRIIFFLLFRLLIKQARLRIT